MFTYRLFQPTGIVRIYIHDINDPHERNALWVANYHMNLSGSRDRAFQMVQEAWAILERYNKRLGHNTQPPVGAE